MRMLSKNTAMLKSNMSKNRLFMVYQNVAGVFIIGIMTHLERPYLMSKVVFRISSSAIWHYQYPLQRSADVKYLILPI